MQIYSPNGAWKVHERAWVSQAYPLPPSLHADLRIQSALSIRIRSVARCGSDLCHAPRGCGSDLRRTLRVRSALSCGLDPQNADWINGGLQIQSANFSDSSAGVFVLTQVAWLVSVVSGCVTCACCGESRIALCSRVRAPRHVVHSSMCMSCRLYVAPCISNAVFFCRSVAGLHQQRRLVCVLLDARVGAALSLAGAPTFLVFVVPVFSTLVLPVLVLVARWGFPSLVFPDVPVVLAVPCLLFLVL